MHSHARAEMRLFCEWCDNVGQDLTCSITCLVLGLLAGNWMLHRAPRAL